ncbi:MAG: T9SS type A sorting domain-containing protein [Chitinophagaceae bacterium]|nr:T9SS type A sorting domain-containing protein [Chitinophagaceae bacterium]MCB9045576.1 T9SS type A sorting domain-containing protein [Chitinophagales bacterium]
MYINSFSTSGGKTTNITNNNSGCDNSSNSYKYYANKVHDGVQGTAVNFSVQIGSSYPQGVKIFVDYNIDGDFDDAGEEVWVSSGSIPAGNTKTGSFVIPQDATPGDSRIRVRSSYSTTSFNACGAQSYGECEDHKFVILPSCTADFPVQPTDKGVCQYGATTFSSTTINAQQFQWQLNSGSGWVDLGDDAIYGGTATTNLHIKNAGLSMQGYKYRLVATNTNDNCSVKSDPASLTLVPTTQSSIVVAAAPSTDICLGEEAILYTSYTNGGDKPEYRWLLNGLEIPGETKASLKIKTLDHGDIVQCRFLSSAQCVPANNSLGIKFSVVSNLLAEVGISTSYNGNNSFTFIADPKNGGTEPRYSWYINGKLLPDETGQSFTTETLKPWDKVSVGMQTSRDCANPKLAMSRLATTGVTDLSDNATNITLSPNPNRGSFTVKSDNITTDKAGIYISNTLGQVVYHAEVAIKNGKLQQDINMKGNVSPGIYMLHIVTGTQPMVMKFTVAD